MKGKGKLIRTFRKTFGKFTEKCLREQPANPAYSNEENHDGLQDYPNENNENYLEQQDEIE